MEYVALDFETANTYPDSACSLGLCKMDEEGNVLDTWYSLIRPHVLYFDPVCTSVHGLDSCEVILSDDFAHHWPQIEEFIGDDVLVAHNAAFDMRVLKHSAAAYGIKLPEYEYYCTYRIARKLIGTKQSYSLSDLVPDLLGFDYQAHLASDDAYACGKLFSFLLHGHLDEKDELEAHMKKMRCAYPKILEPLI